MFRLAFLIEFLRTQNLVNELLTSRSPPIGRKTARAASNLAPLRPIVAREVSFQAKPLPPWVEFPHG